MNQNTKTILIILIALLVFMGILAFLDKKTGSESSAKYDEFSMCLADKGAKFYGAFWCPHCQAQKKLFGSSAKLLPYVECSTADGRGTTQMCEDKKITGYPTWEFADGSRLSGEVSLEKLAETTSCVLPVETVE